MTTSVPDSDDAIREIQAGDAPTRFARGWHCLGLSREFNDGKPHSINAFGTKLVVFAGESGDLKVLDAYCRHMGGDLSQGEVKGDSVACPFHDWRWGGNGKCTGIPYARRVPPLAKTRSWPTLDQDGMLFVYNDPEGNPPPPEVAPPRILGALSDEWTDWKGFKQIVVNTNCRELIDNNVDMAHFFYIHKSFPTYFKNVFEGHVAAQYMNGVGRDDFRRPAAAGEPKLSGNSSSAAYYGPSFMIDELTYHYENFDIESILLNCHYPIDENSFVLTYGVIVKNSEHLDGEAATSMAESMSGFISTGFEQDVEIWKNKARIDNPLLCEQDGPVYQLRRWYEQFYVDVADISPDMVARFEYELDTTRPVESWRQEVADNMAARQ
ncbi:3-ketosteroid-9-alpha-hydroxylase [Rhodococcus sp. ACPA4]|jgi:3-ketosteroid 9alpha-monooxygenase subunit A|uniref:Rieske-type oxygenase n=2 Tax=Nocardiaceae TaxID=85025 RepID=A0A652YQK1_NOCGL|nr:MULTISPECIES: Rieske 2Fe-2S domain-containing protein [Rhodococcus]NMD63569.1 3-ketosteroid-9-alpha-hydroxylase subunit A [Nocardia globerula]KJF24228.1 3-ketosteroid-9-alpha-hydroxylase oxygenase subunit [Rhodococcus sp. AD45]MCE4267022.1 3-ketosteroid-9-alpha-hydroxylase subunit A [Rhodococcus globerulus]MDV6268683.1 Rieske 2Fe-2S domain-containing protein [Rhodococcus globerulus]MDV8065026.1 Rieske 2Fe-2S domain-containing protein [Rhodococcus sp. IEGM 1366]